MVFIVDRRLSCANIVDSVEPDFTIAIVASYPLHNRGEI